MEIYSTPDLKQYNKELIRREIQRHGRSTKAQIAKLTELSVATCNTIINELEADGEVFKAEKVELAMGRPADCFTYNRDFHHVLGIFVGKVRGSCHIDCTVADAMQNVISQRRINMDDITETELKKVIEEYIERDIKINCVSVGIPGVVRNGFIEQCDVPGLAGVRLKKNLSSIEKVFFRVHNDMSFLAYSAYYTVFNAKDDLAVAFFPGEYQGYVGCGFVINGKVLFGHSRFAGEVAYIFKEFGISMAEQIEMEKDMDAFLKYAARVVLIIVSTLNPGAILILGKKLSKEDIGYIGRYCAKVVGETHVPEIIVNDSVEEIYRHGLISSAVNKVQFPITCPF